MQSIAIFCSAVPILGTCRAPGILRLINKCRQIRQKPQDKTSSIRGFAMACGSMVLWRASVRGDFAYNSIMPAVSQRAINAPPSPIRKLIPYADAAKARGIDVIHLNGSIELAPILGLSDVIVDIVETGKTLAENGLFVLEEIEPISARLIANKAHYKFKGEEIDRLVRGLEEVIGK